MRSHEDYERLTASERLPVRIGLGEVTFEEAMLACIGNDERQVGCHRADTRQFTRDRTEEGCERIGSHRLKQNFSIVDLIEFWRIHLGSITVRLKNVP